MNSRFTPGPLRPESGQDAVTAFQAAQDASEVSRAQAHAQEQAEAQAKWEQVHGRAWQAHQRDDNPTIGRRGRLANEAAERRAGFTRRT